MQLVIALARSTVIACGIAALFHAWLIGYFALFDDPQIASDLVTMTPYFGVTFAFLYATVFMFACLFIGTMRRVI